MRHDPLARDPNLLAPKDFCLHSGGGKEFYLSAEIPKDAKANATTIQFETALDSIAFAMEIRPDEKAIYRYVNR